MNQRPIRRVMVLGVLLSGLACSKHPAPPLVKWKDTAGTTWMAPLRTPSPDDPIWTEHPGAGVVLLCSKTGEEVIVSNPDAWMAYRGRLDSPFRSKVGAPLKLPPSP